MDLHESLRTLLKTRRNSGETRRSSGDIRRGSGDRTRNSGDFASRRHDSSMESLPNTRHGSQIPAAHYTLDSFSRSRSSSKERLTSNSDNPLHSSPHLSPSPLHSPLFRNSVFASPPPSPLLPRLASTSTIPHQGLLSNEWTEVQMALVTLFQQKKLEDDKLSELLTILRKMAQSDVGRFIYDFYKNQLMKKGMQILRKSVQSEGEKLLHDMGNLWDHFFGNILPSLQMLLFPIETMELPIRNVTLIGFRDNVVLRKDLEEIILEAKLPIPPSFRQMILILQGIHDDDPPNENYLKLERLVGCVITPHIGYKGVYMEGKPEPTIKAMQQAYRKKSSTVVTPLLQYKRSQSVDFLGQTPPQICHTTPTMQKTRRNLHIRQASTPAGIILEPVAEGSEGSHCRRHSIAYLDDDFQF